MHSKAFLPFPQASFWAHFVQRVKRFSIQCITDDGREIWAHTNNTGSMLGLLQKGNRVFLSPAANPKRKLAYTLELVCLGQNEKKDPWVGVNTQVPGKILAKAFVTKSLPFAQGYHNFAAEVPCGESRIDALFCKESGDKLWVECKNVSLVEGTTAFFPDAKTARGLKHIHCMIEQVEKGDRAAFFYCIQRSDAHDFAPARHIDPAYAEAFYMAKEKGVEVYPYSLRLDEQGISLNKELSILAYRK